MDYFTRTKNDLTELLDLIRNERSTYERLAQVDRAAVDQQLHEQLRAAQAELDEKASALDKLLAEKTKGFPWLAEAWADYEQLHVLREADYLQHKPHPAISAAEQVREHSSLRRRAQKEARIYRYLLTYYETLFPWLVEFKGDDLDELLVMSAQASMDKEEAPGPHDIAQKWLTPNEYESLPPVERNQLALDRWRQKPKSRWEVGRDYERYVGYLYEREGYTVRYQGIVKGFEDLGRDLICSNGDETAVVQCKNWSQEKLIHEKHIFQLYGTVIAYHIEEPRTPARGVFCTTTSLSPRARQFAQALCIHAKEQLPIQAYPCIKCNISRRDGSKIYHLPFDQQYDRTLIEDELSECYAETVAEAEKLGFRRAYRWMGERET